MIDTVPKETILKCLRNIAMRDTACGTAEPEEHTCWMAADIIESQDAMIAEYEAQLRKHYTLEDDICSAFPTNRYLDPPDGGDVSLPEQIGRMWNENLQQRARIAELDEAHGRLKATFRVNMLRCYPDKSHDEIEAEIRAALEKK